jgi:hypothetical protein
MNYRQASIAAIREVYNEKEALRLRFTSAKNSMLMDLFTASAIVRVFDNVNEANKAKLSRMVETPHGLLKVARICMTA